MTAAEKRSALRVPAQIAIDEIVGDRVTRCMTLNLGATGLYLQRLARPQAPPRTLRASAGDPIFVEFELPGTAEVIRARGEIRYDRGDEHFTGSGVRFAAIADMHRQLLAEYIHEQRRRSLHRWWTYASEDGRPALPASSTHATIGHRPGGIVLSRTTA